MLEIQKINVSIGSVNILRNIDIKVDDETFIGVIGRNGAGKTTLMKTIIGLLTHQGGSVKFGDHFFDKDTKPHVRARSGIGYMPEDRRLVPNLTVEENILLPAWSTKITHADRRLQKIFRMIPEIEELKARKAMFLSGGQQKLVSLGRALMCGSKLLLLDEPFEGVAPGLAKRLVELIINLKNTGISVILTESDLTHSRNLLDSVYMIDRGEIIKPQKI